MIWDCNSGRDQYWAVFSNDPCYRIVNDNSGLVIGVAAGSVANNAPVVQWRHQNHNDQHWC